MSGLGNRRGSYPRWKRRYQSTLKGGDPNGVKTIAQHNVLGTETMEEPTPTGLHMNNPV